MVIKNQELQKINDQIRGLEYICQDKCCEINTLQITCAENIKNIQNIAMINQKDEKTQCETRACEELKALKTKVNPLAEEIATIETKKTQLRKILEALV